MSEIKLFENPSFGSVRVIMRENDPWFVAADVCKCLDHSNPSVVIAGLDEDERAKESLGRQGETNIISESGLYTLVIRSNKPEAKDFRRWVTHEVLPSIRKTGEYVIEKPQTLPPTALERLQMADLILSKHYEGNQLVLALDKVHVRLTGESVLKITGTELVAPQQQQLYTPTELGKSTTPILSAIKVNKILSQLGWQIKTAVGWEAVGPGLPHAVYLDTGKAHSDGTPIRQLKWTADAIFAVQAELQ